MKLLFIIIFILINTTKIFAQLTGQAHIDSLLKELPKMKQDTNAVNLLNDLSFSLNQTNPDEGIKYGEQGLNLAKQIKWKLGEAKCYNALGVDYTFGKSDYPKALEYFHKALKIIEKLRGNKIWLANNLGNMGIIYANQSDYPKALKYFHKVLKIYEELGDEKNTAGSIHNIGLIYASQSNYPKALEYFEKAKKINDKPGGNKIWLANNLSGIGTIYQKQSNYPKALEYYHNAFKTF
jgi:TPR repeat protein